MPSGPYINVTPAKDAEIVQFFAPLSAGLNNAAVHSETMRQDYNKSQSPWLELAVDIHRSHQRIGAQARNLDWGSFLREIYNPDNLGQLLMKAMELSETIELALEIGPEACNNNQVDAVISSLRKPNKHQPISPITIIQGIMQALANRVDDEEFDDELKAAAPAKASVAVKRTLQRQFRARGNDEEDEEPEDTQSSKGQTAPSSMITEAELNMFLQAQHEHDELLSRFRNKEAAEVDGSLRLMMGSLLESVFRPTEGILDSRQSGGVLAFLESEKRQRKILG
ncbi:hypothetical protein CGLO_14905 [Colletotrichum gloeosporioides Cg-14]|uniref:Uncharacterized protein n=1 Tax=Colletotrichum gloeosporioides (strain Cg-14) TaxID=1237896 RepID=T0JSK5_COLGC|nr:hypothetical protein CGLO_14905 [Colletotrichum gloeosporioides Cg-14]